MNSLRSWSGKWLLNARLERCISPKIFGRGIKSVCEELKMKYVSRSKKKKKRNMCRYISIRANTNKSADISCNSSWDLAYYFFRVDSAIRKKYFSTEAGNSIFEYSVSRWRCTKLHSQTEEFRSINSAHEVRRALPEGLIESAVLARQSKQERFQSRNSVEIVWPKSTGRRITRLAGYAGVFAVRNGG